MKGAEAPEYMWLFDVDSGNCLGDAVLKACGRDQISFRRNKGGTCIYIKFIGVFPTIRFL
jgi:hypothetical protein